MKIRHVTLTGADDHTDPAALVRLRAAYPYSEWAVLFSQRKAGVPRYPSIDWVRRLNAAFDESGPEAGPTRLAAHLCGKWVDDALGGRLTFVSTYAFNHNLFARLQLNLGKDRLARAVGSRRVEDVAAEAERPVILGGNYAAVTADPEWFRGHNLHPLFDASGGRGAAQDTWPAPLAAGLLCGYAGGLGPDTLADDLKRIEDVVGDATVWIDMESRIRDDSNRLDLGKCERVLEIARPWAE